MEEESVPLDPDFKEWVLARISHEALSIRKNASEMPQETVKAMHSRLQMLRIDYRKEKLTNVVVNCSSHPQEIIDAFCRFP